MVTKQNSRAIIVALVSVFIFGSALHCYRGYYSRYIRTAHAQGADDAYISYRYGWNLAQYGIVAWNESGFRRVEGFTNPLWVYLSALVSLLGHKEIVYPAMAVVSVVCCCVLIAFLAFLVLESCREEIRSIVGIFLFSASPVVWLHATSGLESAIFGLLIGVTAWLTLGASTMSEKKVGTVVAAFVFLAILLRSDGFVYVLPILLASVVVKKPYWKHILVALLIGITILLAWRYFTFGSLIPNTAVAKLNGSLHERQYVGREILAEVLFDDGVGIFLLVGLVGMSLAGNPRLLAAAMICIASWLGYFVYVGGDHFLERHLIAAMAFSAAISSPLWLALRRSSSIVLFCAVLGFIYEPVLRGDNRFSYRERKLPDVWIKMGSTIAMDRERYGIIVTGAAGKIPFYGGGDFVDIIGLNDPELSRIQRRPFWPGHSSGDKVKAISIAYQMSSKVSFSGYYPADMDSLVSLGDTAKVLLWCDNTNPNISGEAGIPSETLVQAMGSPYRLSMIVLLQNRLQTKSGSP